MLDDGTCPGNQRAEPPIQVRKQRLRRIGAAEALRELIDAIVLTPEQGTLKIELQGIWLRC